MAARRNLPSPLITALTVQLYAALPLVSWAVVMVRKGGKGCVVFVCSAASKEQLYDINSARAVCIIEDVWSMLD